MDTIDTATIAVRALAGEEYVRAAELIQLTNDDADAAALLEDLAECGAKWPGIQLGAFARQEKGLWHMAGSIAGRLDRHDEKTGWSDDIVVLPEYRGLDIGHRLLCAQLDGFRRLGCARVRGRSPARLFGAIGFFERHGFRVVERTIAQGIWGIKDGEELCLTECVL